MPRKHKQEIVRFAFVAVLSSTYFITLGILSQHIPSRSLAARVVLPNPAAPRAAWLQETLRAPIDAPSPSRLRARPLRARAVVQLASLREAPGDEGRSGSISLTPARRPNIFSRFFRGVFHSNAPLLAKADVP